MIIESLQNDRIKRLMRLLTKNHDRKTSKTFVVEGAQENERALKFGYLPVEFYICRDIFKGNITQATCFEVNAKVYSKIAYRGTTEGIIGVYHEKEADLKQFEPAENSSVILLESAEKPGNLGAVLRSCEAFGIDALIITDSKVDFYNPNVIRSSVGCLFGMNIFQSDNQTAFQFLKSKGFHVLTTFMDEEKRLLPNADLTGKTAVCFGTEHSGLTDFWLDKGQNYLIPMAGTIDSLNLSNAVAITCYEMLRQRLT